MNRTESLTLARLRKTQRRAVINWAVSCGGSRGRPPCTLSDPERKPYQRINSQFSVRHEWRWTSSPSVSVLATTFNYIWARLLCRLGREALGSVWIEYQEKNKRQRILGKQILEVPRGQMIKSHPFIQQIRTEHLSQCPPSSVLGQQDLVPALKQLTVSDRHVNNWLWYNANINKWIKSYYWHLLSGEESKNSSPWWQTEYGSEGDGRRISREPWVSINKCNEY